MRSKLVFLPDGADWTLKRLIVLPGGIPAAGPPPQGVAAATVPAPVKTAQAEPGKARPGKKVPRVKAVTMPPPATRAPQAAPQAAVLGGSAGPKAVPGVVAVDLRATSAALAGLNPPRSKGIAIATPAEECSRSSADWPAIPLRIAVLDFRYPTEREEAHDIGSTGGGSGTAVADLVFARLVQAEQADDRYLYSRGDRRRLDRSDFAGRRGWDGSSGWTPF